MVQKWIKGSNKEFGTTVWLNYEKADHKHVATLQCSVCIEFNDTLMRMHNYNSVLVGTMNLRSSSNMYKDTAVTDMHK